MKTVLTNMRNEFSIFGKIYLCSYAGSDIYGSEQGKKYERIANSSNKNVNISIFREVFFFFKLKYE